MKNNVQKYSNKVYSLSAIKKAINDYGNIARILLSEKEGYYTCEFYNCQIDSQRVMLEFDNYLVELMNTKSNNDEI